jgi:hypothetical protein
MKKEPELKQQYQGYDKKEVFEAARITRDDFIRYTYAYRLQADPTRATAAGISAYLRELCPEFAVSTKYVNMVIRSRPLVTPLNAQELAERCELYSLRLRAAASALKAALNLEE